MYFFKVQRDIIFGSHPLTYESLFAKLNEKHDIPVPKEVADILEKLLGPKPEQKYLTPQPNSCEY
jgi:hypothetical protein